MGSVYTWESIREGRIPSPKSFKVAAEFIRSAIKQEPTIMVAVMCGSVLRGDHNRRSDIDCAVLYETRNERAAISAMQTIGQLVHDTHHIPLNWIPIDSDLARSDMHQMGSSFVHHIKLAAGHGGTIKGHLSQALWPTQSVADEVRSYVRAKLYNLVEGAADLMQFSEERQMSYLKKVLESPMHIARKMLHVSGVMRGDSKEDVCTLYSAATTEECRNIFEKLLKVDASYTSAVEHQVRNPSLDEYTRVIGSVIQAIPLAIEFARFNALNLDATRP